MADTSSQNEGHSVSRQHFNSTTSTAIDRGFELRNVVVAMGIERTNEDIEKQVGANGKHPNYKYEWQKSKVVDLWKIPNNNGKILNEIPVEKVGSESGEYYVYKSDKQRVIFHLYVVKKKSDFKKWLETPKTHVIYGGHSRYGRGACFGDGVNDPGDRWEDGIGCTKGNIGPNDGLLRLGYPIVGIPITDINKHMYHTAPVQEEPIIDKKTCHPEVVKMVPIRRMRIDPNLDKPKKKYNSFNATHEKWGWWKWDDHENCIRIASDLPLKLIGLENLFYKGDPKKDVWGYRKYEHEYKGYKLHILLHAGWKETNTSPWDIGKVNLKCKVFCHFGCSSFKHFHKIIRGKNYKNWKKTGKGRNENRFAYFTSLPSCGMLTPVWLKHLFLFKKRNAYKSWRHSLEYARIETSKELRHKWRQRYRVI
jgi:hypothetical protein